jgi:hypothetical protein
MSRPKEQDLDTAHKSESEGRNLQDMKISQVPSPPLTSLMSCDELY